MAFAPGFSLLPSLQVSTAIFKCFCDRLPFGMLERRHHCRLCGGVICGRAECSLFIPLHRLDNVIVDVRVCPACHASIFRPSTSMSSSSLIFGIDEEWPLEHEYARLQQRKQQIEDLLAQFTDKLAQFHEAFSGEDGESLEELRHEIVSCKETLLLVISFYESIAKGIRDLPVDDTLAIGTDVLRAPLIFEQQVKQLQSDICRAALTFVQGQRYKLRLTLPEERDRQKLLRRTASSPVALGSSVSRLMQSVYIPQLIESANNQLRAIARQSRRGSHTRSTEQAGSPNADDHGIVMANLPALMQRLDVFAEQRASLELQINLSRDEGEKEILREALAEVDDEIRRLQVAVSGATAATAGRGITRNGSS